MSRRTNLSVLVLAVLAPVAMAAQTAPAPPPAPPAANRWNVDPAHSAVTFRVRHLGITWVNGAFRRWTAELTYDPDHVEASGVTARIETASVDTENERRDGDLRENFLVVDSFPEMTFTSRQVERVGGGAGAGAGAPERLRIAGDLTIHDVTRAVILDTEVGAILTTRQGRRTAFSAATTIRRRDFGLTFNRFMEGLQAAGEEVHIVIDIEAVAPTAP